MTVLLRTPDCNGRILAGLGQDRCATHQVKSRWRALHGRTQRFPSLVICGHVSGRVARQGAGIRDASPHQDKHSDQFRNSLSLSLSLSDITRRLLIHFQADESWWRSFGGRYFVVEEALIKFKEQGVVLWHQHYVVTVKSHPLIRHGLKMKGNIRFLWNYIRLNFLYSFYEFLAERRG